MYQVTISCDGNEPDQYLFHNIDNAITFARNVAIYLSDGVFECEELPIHEEDEEVLFSIKYEQDEPPIWITKLSFSDDPIVQESES